MNDMNTTVLENLHDLAALLSQASYDAPVDPTVGIDATDEADE